MNKDFDETTDYVMNLEEKVYKANKISLDLMAKLNGVQNRVVPATIDLFDP